MSAAADPEKPKWKLRGPWASLWLALRNPRFRAVALQSFSSGLPLGLVWIAMPAWLKYQNVDIRTIGLFSLAQAPWNFKFLWSPLMDRFSPGFAGRKRSWMLITEFVLIAAIAALSVESIEPQIVWVFVLGFAIAFASASQDIVIDGYAVEILAKEEMGKAVGARVAMYRIAMYLSGGMAITLGQTWGWPVVYAWIAAAFFPMLVVVAMAPEPAVPAGVPKSLRDAVVEPMIAMFKKARALEILLFIVLYKIGENLATALIRPFLIEKGFTAADVGVVLTTLNMFATIGGTFAGGILTDRIGMGRTLWISGILQAAGCLAYALVDQVGGPVSTSPGDTHRLVMLGAVGIEQFLQGMGAGALGVLMLRLTAKQFSSTQFALLSSLMALPRVIVGPFAGVLAYSLGWTAFFLFTVPIAIPGLVMLHRFVPFGARDAQIEDSVEGSRTPVTVGGLLLRAAIALGISMVIAITWSGVLAGMADSRKAILAAKQFADVRPFIETNIVTHLHALIRPSNVTEWVDLAGPVVFALLIAAATAALTAARRGVSRNAP